MKYDSVPVTPRKTEGCAYIRSCLENQLYCRISKAVASGVIHKEKVARSIMQQGILYNNR